MSFTNFPEQRQVVQLLQRSLERNRLAHAYLFTGSEMGELEAMARTLAKTLNCENPKRGANNAAVDSCDHCLTCRKIDGENHPDVLWIRPESKSRIITIEQIRDLIQTVNLKPTAATFQLGIISGADRLNVQAANAFLKTLEEPPPHSILVLLATEPQRILETILSRCLRLNFSGEKKLSPTEISWLASFAEMAIQTKGGLMGRYRLLGILVKKLAEARAEIEQNLTARSPLERYDELDPKMREKLEDELSAAIEAEYRRQRSEFLMALQLWLRDVWLRTLSISEEMLSLTPLSAATDAVAKRLATPDAQQNLQVLEDTQRLLHSNVQEALTLEVGFLKLKL